MTLKIRTGDLIITAIQINMVVTGNRTVMVGREKKRIGMVNRKVQILDSEIQTQMIVNVTRINHKIKARQISLTLIWAVPHKQIIRIEIRDKYQDPAQGLILDLDLDHLQETTGQKTSLKNSMTI